MRSWREPLGADLNRSIISSLVIFTTLGPLSAFGSPVVCTRFKALIYLKRFGAGACGALASTSKSLAQTDKSIFPTLNYGTTALLHSEEMQRQSGGRSKPMQCECLLDRPNQGLVRCANKATQRLTISHLKIRLLVCEACAARQLAWAEPYRSLPGLVVVEPVE